MNLKVSPLLQGILCLHLIAQLKPQLKANVKNVILLISCIKSYYVT